MRINNEKIFVFSFGTLCTFGAIGLSSYWIYKYWLDEEVSVVHYTKFQESSDNVFPTLSLCVTDPFVENRLAEYGSNQTSYSEFLAGKVFSKELMSINYSYVTTDIADFIKGYKIDFKNATEIEITSGLSVEEKKLLTISSFNGFFSWNEKFVKCFAFIIPQLKDLEVYRLLFSNQLFSNGLRKGQMQAAIHLPNQLLLSWFTRHYTWPDQSKSSRYKTRIFVRSMDVVVNRNNKKEKCNEHWTEYDDWVARTHAVEVGCINPYQDIGKEFPICDDKKKMDYSKFYQDITLRKQYIKPCRTMQNIHLDWTEENYDEAEDGTFGEFWIGIYFSNDIFKEIVQSR